MIENSAQPHRKAVIRPYASRKYTYGPPACGSSAASSASDSDPDSVAAPPSSHTAIIAPNDGTLASMLLTFKKMPLPMIEPTTIITASNGPSTRGKTSTLLASGARTGGDMTVPFWILNFRFWIVGD